MRFPCIPYDSVFSHAFVRNVHYVFSLLISGLDIHFIGFIVACFYCVNSGFVLHDRFKCVRNLYRVIYFNDSDGILLSY